MRDEIPKGLRPLLCVYRCTKYRCRHVSCIDEITALVSHDLSVKTLEVFGYLFHVGDVAGDVLHSDRILYSQAVALTLHSSSVNQNPCICGQACRLEEPGKMYRVCMILILLPTPKIIASFTVCILDSHTLLV